MFLTYDFVPWLKRSENQKSNLKYPYRKSIMAEKLLKLARKRNNFDTQYLIPVLTISNEILKDCIYKEYSFNR